MTGLTIRHLTAGYGRRTVFKSLSAGPFSPGQITAIIGPNGSGKSTLLKAIAGLLKPDSGVVMLDDQELTRQSFADRAHWVAYLPQSPPPAIRLSVLESVLVAARASNPFLEGPIPLSAAGAQGVLQQLDMAALALTPLNRLSGGQRQLAGLAQAMVRQPRLLLLDEPLSSLDLRHQWQVMSLLAQETRERALITLIVLHDLNAVLQHCDQALLLHGGQAVCQGRPTEVITPRALADHYGITARVEPGTHGIPHVTIDGPYPLTSHASNFG